MEAGDEHPSHHIAANITGNGGQEIDLGVGVDHEADFLGGEGAKLAEGGDIRLQADVARIDPREQVAHGRISRDHHSIDPLPGNPGCICHFADQGVNGPDDSPLQLLKAPRLGRVDDAADDVIPVASLPVVAPAGGQDLPRRHVDQGEGDGGSADIDGQSIGLGGARRHPDGFGAGSPVHLRQAHQPVSLPQGRRQLADYPQGWIPAPQLSLNPIPVGGVIQQAGRGQLTLRDGKEGCKGIGLKAALILH